MIRVFGAVVFVCGVLVGTLLVGVVAAQSQNAPETVNNWLSKLDLAALPPYDPTINPDGSAAAGRVRRGVTQADYPAGTDAADHRFSLLCGIWTVRSPETLQMEQTDVIARGAGLIVPPRIEQQPEYRPEGAPWVSDWAGTLLPIQDGYILDCVRPAADLPAAVRYRPEN